LRITREPTVITGGTIIKRDTFVVTRYETELVKDTVIKWHEKIIKTKSEPEIIYVQKIDSVFFEKIRYKDLMLKVDKYKNNLKIFAVNENDSLIKEYFFPNVYNNFTAVSATGNIVVKTSDFEWSGLNTSLSFQRQLKSDISWSNLFNESFFAAATVKSGITFKDKLSLNLVGVIPVTAGNTGWTSLSAGLELSYKILK
jgi:hypothetical protein